MPSYVIKNMNKMTEQDSLYRNLDKMETAQLVEAINQEDHKVALAVRNVLPKISELVDVVFEKMNSGGRLFYLGAGTSGRLGVLDASECPPTFGVSNDRVIALIAGGDAAIRNSVEQAEDDTNLAWEDLQKHHISSADVVLGISASGSTTYVVEGLRKCQSENIFTAALTSNAESLLNEVCDLNIELLVGPEFIAGSTRMKAGTAQKMVLNMLSTVVMIKLGHVLDNKMIDMKLSNKKLLDRGAKMIAELKKVDYDLALKALLKHGSVRAVLESDFNSL